MVTDVNAGGFAAAMTVIGPSGPDEWWQATIAQPDDLSPSTNASRSFTSGVFERAYTVWPPGCVRLSTTVRSPGTGMSRGKPSGRTLARDSWI